jgi:hypothetical protein
MDVVVCGNFHVGNRDIAPVFTKTGWWYDYITGDSLQVTDVNVAIPYVPGEYHVYTTKKVTFDFDITSSIADINISSQPLEIYPTLNQGQFDILLPSDAVGTPIVHVWDMTGNKIDIRATNESDRIGTQLLNPTPGVYVVNVIVGRMLYTGKVVVQ